MPVFLRWLLRLGPINPVAVRLVQGGSRRTRHFYIRAAYLGALILCLLWLLLIKGALGSSASLSQRDLAAAAANAFTAVAYLQITLICLLAPVFMAGAIAQEANPRTWDILLTTPLSAVEIVLGNLFGRLFFILALLFSSLPLFALTQYFGGVPGSSIFISYLIAAGAAILVGSMAIALSVSRLVGKRAVFAFYVGVVSYLAITFAIDNVIGGGRSVTWMTGLNPFLALRATLDPTNYARPEGAMAWPASLFLQAPVKAWCFLSLGISAVLMVISTFTVRLGGIAGLGGLGGRGSGTVPWYRKIFGLGARGAEHRAPKHVWHNPVAWREAAARNATLGKMAARWSFIAIGGLWAAGVVLYFHVSNPPMPVETFRTIVLSTALGELGVVALVAINMSATAVAREREDGTLDILLTTPLTPGAYLSGKLRGIIAYILPLLAVPLGTLLLAGAYTGLVMGGVIERAGGAVHVTPTSVTTLSVPVVAPAVLPEAAIVAGVVTLPFIALCVMIGMQWSVKSKGSIGSVIATVGIVLAFAGITGACAYKAGSDIELVGPSLAAMSPASVVFAMIEPEVGMRSAVHADDLFRARIGLFIGSLIFAAIYLAFVYGIHENMKRTFDMTVRKLAGTA